MIVILSQKNVCRKIYTYIMIWNVHERCLLYAHFKKIYLPLQIKHTINKLQAVVCSDGRFRAMREALHRCDPPCIPYLGMYLTDLSFIEEGTPDFTPDRLLNFSKMRMVCYCSLTLFILTWIIFSYIFTKCSLRMWYEKFGTSNKLHTKSITFRRSQRICSMNLYCWMMMIYILVLYKSSHVPHDWVHPILSWCKHSGFWHN